MVGFVATMMLCVLLCCCLNYVSYVRVCLLLLCYVCAFLGSHIVALCFKVVLFVCSCSCVVVGVVVVAVCVRRLFVCDF